MKLRNITSVLVMAALAGVCSAEPLIYMTGGGGGSIKPAATNAVLEAAIAYTDSATNAVVEAFIASDPNLWANQSRLTVDGNAVTAGNYTTVVMNDNTVTFEMTDAGEYSVVVDAYAEIDASLFLAVAETVPGQKWDVLFTSGTLGEPIDFYLLVTVQPKAGIGSRDSKTLIYKLRRTF